MSCRGYMLSCRGYMHVLQRLYDAGYSDNKANSARFQLGLGLSLAKISYHCQKVCDVDETLKEKFYNFKISRPMLI